MRRPAPRWTLSHLLFYSLVHTLHDLCDLASFYKDVLIDENTNITKISSIALRHNDGSQTVTNFLACLHFQNTFRIPKTGNKINQFISPYNLSSSNTEKNSSKKID